MDISFGVLIGCVVAFTAVGAASDLWTKRLPNALTVTGFAAGLIFHIVDGFMNHGGFAGAGLGLLYSLGGFAIGFGILFVLWLIGGGGGGDVKMMGALGAWLGPTMILQVFFLSIVFVIIGTVGVLAWEACRTSVFKTKQRYLSPPDEKAAKMQAKSGKESAKVRRRILPYGVPIALATWGILILAANGLTF